MDTRVNRPTSVFFIESLLLPDEKRSSMLYLRYLSVYGFIWWLDSDAVHRAWHTVSCTILLYLLLCQVAREQPTPQQAFRANPKSMV